MTQWTVMHTRQYWAVKNQQFRVRVDRARTTRETITNNVSCQKGIYGYSLLVKVVLQIPSVQWVGATARGNDLKNLRISTTRKEYTNFVSSRLARPIVQDVLFSGLMLLYQGFRGSQIGLTQRPIFMKSPWAARFRQIISAAAGPA